MTNVKITAENFLDSRELREQAMERVEVLDKVKQLFLIPELECMTTKQVADYYEVDIDTVKKQYQRNRDEFDDDGTHIKKLSDFKSLEGTRCPHLKMTQMRGFLEITFSDNTVVAINNKGVKCFPKRAILRMGMLLRGSRVAKEIRTQLLNTFEHATEEQRTAEIDEEMKLRNNIALAYGKDNPMEVLQACSMLDAYRMRYIATIEHHNAELHDTVNTLNNEINNLTGELTVKDKTIEQKNAVIEEVKPKTEFYDTIAETKGLTTMSQFAKSIYEKSGIKLGRNRLFAWLRNIGLLRNNNEPYQQYVNAGYFVVKEYVYLQAGRPEIGFTTYLTGKGQQYILNKLKEAFTTT